MADLAPSDIEKLIAIGYEVSGPHPKFFGRYAPTKALCVRPEDAWDRATEAEAWANAKAHAQSPQGMKVTMADKLAWLHGARPGEVFKSWGGNGSFGCGIPGGVFADQNGYGPLPEAAVDDLFWKTRVLNG